MYSKIEIRNYENTSKNITLVVTGSSGWIEIDKESYKKKNKDGNSYTTSPSVEIYIERNSTNTEVLKQVLLHILSHQKETSELQYIIDSIKEGDNPLDCELFCEEWLGEYSNLIDDRDVDWGSDKAKYFPCKKFYKIKASYPPFYAKKGGAKVKTFEVVDGVKTEFTLTKSLSGIEKIQTSISLSAYIDKNNNNRISFNLGSWGGASVFFYGGTESPYNNSGGVDLADEPLDKDLIDTSSSNDIPF